MELLQVLKEKLEMVIKAISDKRALLDKEEDVVKQKAITDEIMALQKETGKLESEIAFEVKNLESARTQAKSQSVLAGNIPAKGQKIEVGTPDNYKGFNLKREVYHLQKSSSVPEKMRQNFEAHPERAEAVSKWFIDLASKALDRRLSPDGLKAAMQEGTDSEGGYLRTNEVMTEVLSYIRDESIALQDANVVRMNSNVMTVPSELTKVAVGPHAEEEAESESEPTFSVVTLTARRVGAYGIVSNELFDDNFVSGGITAALLPQFIEAIGQYLDSAVFIGSGADSAVFSGVFLTTGYSQVFGSGSSNFSELLEADVRLCIAKVPERYIRVNGKWYINQTVLWQYFRALKDSYGGYMFNESRSGQAAPDTLWGYPIRKPTQSKSTSAASTAMAVFGNLKAVMIGERLGDMQLFWDPYTRGEYYQSRFILHNRWAFAHALPNMLSRIVTAA